MAWVADARVGFGLLAFATARFSLGADPAPELADFGRRLAPRCVLFGGEPLGEGPHVVEPVVHHDRGARDAVAGDRVSHGAVAFRACLYLAKARYPPRASHAEEHHQPGLRRLVRDPRLRRTWPGTGKGHQGMAVRPGGEHGAKMRPAGADTGACGPLLALPTGHRLDAGKGASTHGEGEIVRGDSGEQATIRSCRSAARWLSVDIQWTALSGIHRLFRWE